MNRKDWITILASSVTTIFVCIITIWSNININSKINETNLLISDTTSKTTFSINNQEQLESRFRYIADLMVRFLYKGIIINHNKNRANLH